MGSYRAYFARLLCGVVLSLSYEVFFIYRNNARAAQGRALPPLSVSQNYLTSSVTIARLLGIAGIGPGDDVLEIGPGKGHITRALAARCRSLCAVEKDAALHERLCVSMGGLSNLTLMRGDFLSMRLPRGAYKVFSNIPFSITTPIIEKLTRAPNPPGEAWLIMEKGAAKRFMGKPHETVQSLLLKPFFDMDIVYHFSRNDFHPAPSVDVVMVRITRKARPDIQPSERGAYAAFVRHGQKYGLFGGRALLAKRRATAALKRARLPLPETDGCTLYIQWLCLFRCHMDKA